MPVKIIDASALAAILFGEPEAEAIVSRVQGFSLVAPALLPFEVASVCLKKLLRDPGQRSVLLNAYSLLARMEIASAEVDLNQVILLAERKGLTVYDASYLWLARRLAAEVVSLDQHLAKAAASPLA